MATLFVVRHVLLALAAAVAIVMLGLTIGFQVWKTDNTEIMGAVYLTEEAPPSYELYFWLAPVLTLIMLLIMFIYERVRRRSMLTTQWEAVYIGLNWAMWLGAAVVGRTDQSPFSRSFSGRDRTDRCINAQGNVKTLCNMYLVSTIFAFFEMALLLAWFCVVVTSGANDPFWTRPGANRAATHADEHELKDARPEHKEESV